MTNLSRSFFLLSIILCLWAYYPGLSGNFVFDDAHNITDNEGLKITQFTFDDIWQASFSGASGPLRRPVSMLSFAINHISTGMDAWWMKITNLLIHILNGLVLLFVCKELIRRLSIISELSNKAFPYIVAGIWLVHPVNITSVTYIVQRMNSLSALFTLSAIYCYLKLRNNKAEGWQGNLMIISIPFLWLLGLLSKENAILLGVYIFVLEWCLYDFKINTKFEKMAVKIIVVSSVGSLAMCNSLFYL